MKRVLLFVLTLTVVNTLVSQEGYETTYYANGDLEKIKYPIAERFGSEIRYFKKSMNLRDRNQPSVDTIFNNDRANDKDWTYYDGSVRIFLHQRSSIYIGKATKNGSNRDQSFRTINGYYSYVFRDFGDLELTLTYNKDSTITYFCIQEKDTTKRGDVRKELFFLSRYDPENGARFDTSQGTHIYRCGAYGELSLQFDKNNLLKTVIFYRENNRKPAIVYDFYSNFFCKSHWYSVNGLPTDEWVEYYDNGNIKTIGTFEIFTKDLIRDSRKHGRWEYFNTDGSKLREENWKHGKLFN